MSMPRRKTCSLRNSLWSWSSTGVRFMGEKPIAGCPAWGWGWYRVRPGLGRAPGAPLCPGTAPVWGCRSHPRWGTHGWAGFALTARM